MPAITKLAYAGVLGFTVLIAFIEMIIAAILVNSYNSSGYPTTHFKNAIRYTLFVSLWNLFIGGGFAALTVFLGTSIIASVASNAAFLFITWLFWLASGASLDDAQGGVHSCSNPLFAHCNQLRALEAFAWINFIIFFVTFVGVLYLGFKQAKKGNGYTGPIAV